MSECGFRIEAENLQGIARPGTAAARLLDVWAMAVADPATGPMLRVVEPTTDGSAEWSWFAVHCGAGHPARDPRADRPRVRFGVVSGRAQAAPTPPPGWTTPFWWSTPRSPSRPMSRRAEPLLGVREDHAVNCHVSELLIPAEAEGAEPVGLAVAITRSARGDEDALRITVRPSNTFGVRMERASSPARPPASRAPGPAWSSPPIV